MHGHSQQLLVTGSDTLTVCIFCANHYQASATGDKSQPAIFLSLETYFTTIKICIMFSALPNSFSEIKVCIQGEADIFCVFSLFSIKWKLCCTAADIWNEKENRLLYRMPKWTHRNIQSGLLHITGYRAKNSWWTEIFIEGLWQRYVQQLPN